MIRATACPCKRGASVSPLVDSNHGCHQKRRLRIRNNASLTPMIAGIIELTAETAAAWLVP